MRADRLGALPDGTVPAPILTQLASEGVRFTNAFSQSGWTGPALATLLTGHYPTALQSGLVTTGGAPSEAWAPGIHTVAEILSYYGYDTAAFWGNSGPSRSLVYSVGFAHTFTLPLREGTTNGRDVADWIEHSAREPFFALVHNVDLSNEVSKQHAPDNAKEVVDLYDATLGAYDKTIGLLRASLETRGVAKRTVIVIVSNHGLDFFGHGPYVVHGTLFDPVIHIPFVIVDPQATAHGTNDTVIQGIDLTPTILARSGATADATAAGHSLLPLLGWPGSYTPTDVYTMSSQMDLAVRSDGYKLIACRSDCCGAARQDDMPKCAGAQVFKLFDLAADPDEHHDIAASEPERVKAYMQKLKAWQATTLGPVDTGQSPQFPIDPAQKKMLQERGYWDLMFPHGDAPLTKPPSAAP